MNTLSEVRSRQMNRTPKDAAKPKVVIAGGGVAAVEAMLALRDLAGDRAEVEVHAPRQRRRRRLRDHAAAARGRAEAGRLRDADR